MVPPSFKVLLLGDFHYGESYSAAGALSLSKNGYRHSTKYLQRFVDAVDVAIANLETPIVDPVESPSPLVGRKSYIHWADPRQTPQALRELGIDAVSLANNHTLDHGAVGVLRSFEYLDDANIAWFGAGRTIDEARAPYTVQLPGHIGGGEIRIFGSFQYSRRHDDEYGFYASAARPGCAPLGESLPASLRPSRGRSDAFNIAFPHWGSNYKWRGAGQRRIAQGLLDGGFDLIVGHGSHSIQEIERRARRWVIYGIGNGNFLSGGRFKRYAGEAGVLPMGFWAILHIEGSGADRHVSVKLYPVYSDNRETNFQAHPVDQADFAIVEERLRARLSVPGRFDNSAKSTGIDELGAYVRLDLGPWPTGAPPSRLSPEPIRRMRGRGGAKPSVGRGERPGKSGRSPLGLYEDSDSLYVREQQAKRGRNVAPLLISRIAEREGATTEWVDPRIAIVTKDDRRVLLQGHRGGESAVGRALISDKYLCKILLLGSGVSTPRGDLARTAEEAIAIRDRFDSPVVVKPRFGQKQRAVSVNLTRDADIVTAFEQARVWGDVVVEEYVEGTAEYRCLTTPDECVSVVRRILPYVIGDGIATIRELIELKNGDRALNPSTYGRPIPIDDGTLRYLNQAGLAYDYVPALGENVTVRNIGGLSTGGEPEECSDRVDGGVKALATAAARAIPGLAWGGVDVLVSRAGEPYIIEINSDADIAGASFPFFGKPAPVAERIWSMRLEQAGREPSAPQGALALANPPMDIRGDLVNARQRWGKTRLADLFLLQLEREGVLVRRESPTVASLVDDSGETRWFQHALGTEDLASVTDVTEKHRVVRRILGLSQVMRTRGRRVRSMTELREFTTENPGTFYLIPYLGSWDSASKRMFAGFDDVDVSEFNRRRSWIVQTRPMGARVTVAASPQEPLVVLGDEVVPTGVIQAAADHAVRAVKSVPGLRWAAVDIVVVAGKGGRAVPQVEGVALNPSLAKNALLLAGSLERLWQLVREH